MEVITIVLPLVALALVLIIFGNVTRTLEKQNQSIALLAEQVQELQEKILASRT